MPGGKEMGQKAMDNRSNQLNPNNANYQGGQNRHTTSLDQAQKAALDNRAKQLNPNNWRYQGKK